MHIEEIEIKNFRLLKEVILSVDDQTTVIVGRNNSGKTSLTELMRRLFSEKNVKFRLEDFSLCCHEKFWDAFMAHEAKSEDYEVREVLPKIELSIKVNYDKTIVNLGPLSDFVVDLDVGTNNILVNISYQLDDGAITSLFSEISLDSAKTPELKKNLFFKSIKNRIPNLYRLKIEAVDPNDSTNRRELDLNKFSAMLKVGFISAQRGLDDETFKEKDVLGKIIESLFKTADNSASSSGDGKTANELQLAINEIGDKLSGEFNDGLQKLMPKLKMFGYPGLRDPNIVTETTLDAQRLLSDHTKIKYSGINGVTLPETYNGLGSRNLIFILFKLFEFFKTYKADPVSSSVHIVFIEEPEAHLHPQMQEVFIRQLGIIKKAFIDEFNEGADWPVQFVISTHSPHIANEAPFDTLRYFVAKEDVATKAVKTEIKDLHTEMLTSKGPVNDFLHQYMTLTYCDLLFADKVILIEGTCERLLVPKMIKKFDGEKPGINNLTNQYISILEVGGAHAYNFIDLVTFLELPTLIISDIDSVKVNESSRRAACPVSVGKFTSNSTIKNWFSNSDISIPMLTSKKWDDKVKDKCALAYQVEEDGVTACGRSLEQAFVLANIEKFSVNISQTVNQIEIDVEDAIDKYSGKTDFALEFAIKDNEWKTPKYIKEGLQWLQNIPSVNDVDTEMVETIEQINIETIEKL